MKTILNKNGCLRIIGESSVEQFALTKWYEEWEKGNCVFQVECLGQTSMGAFSTEERRVRPKVRA